MRIINLARLNLDYTYSVDHIVEPGETQDTKERKIFCGGKGLNQSIRTWQGRGWTSTMRDDR